MFADSGSGQGHPVSRSATLPAETAGSTDGQGQLVRGLQTFLPRRSLAAPQEGVGGNQRKAFGRSQSFAGRTASLSSGALGAGASAPEPAPGPSLGKQQTSLAARMLGETSNSLLRKANCTPNVLSETFPECLGPAPVAARKEVNANDLRLRCRWTSHHSQQLWPDELVNEMGTETLRQHRNERDKLLKKRSEQAVKSHLAAAEGKQLRLESEIGVARAKQLEEPPGLAAKLAKNPNAHFALSQRHGRHMILCGDGRSKLLTRVFLNGSWTYAT